MNAHLYFCIPRFQESCFSNQDPGLVIPVTLGKRKMWREVQNIYTALTVLIYIWVGSILAVIHKNHKN